MKTITIKENGTTIHYSTRVNENILLTHIDIEDGSLNSHIIDYAVCKIFGRTASFVQNHGLPLGYGQIFKPCSTRGLTSITNCVNIDID